MSIEDSVISHYRNVEIDDGAHQRLQSMITDLANAPEHPALRRLMAAGVTALIVVGCVAGAVWADRVPDSHHAAASDLSTPSPDRITNTGPFLPSRTGFIGVTNARGVNGLIRARDSNDVDLRSTSAAADARLNGARLTSPSSFRSSTPKAGGSSVNTTTRMARPPCRSGVRTVTDSRSASRPGAVRTAHQCRLPAS